MNTNLREIALLSVTTVLAIATPLLAANTDSRIESAAKKSYVYRTYLKDDNIDISSKDGVVTLSGTVAEDSHKSLAEDTVKGLPGVKEVDNQLVSKSENSSAASDDWISAKVKAALLFHRSVSAKTQVYVKDGNVTLKGTADSQAEKDLTTAYARDIDGVEDVNNEMTVAPSPPSSQTLSEKVDDASITAQVKGALLTHRSTSAIRTSVETKEGVVTITGTAQNQAEKDLVTKLAEDIHGVKNVHNEMTTES